MSQYSGREMVIYAGLTEVKTSLTNIETTRATLAGQRTTLDDKLSNIKTNALRAINAPSCTTANCNSLRTSLNTLGVAPVYTVT